MKRMFLITAACCLAPVAPLFQVVAAPSAPAVHQEIMADGVELIVIHTAGQPRVAFRGLIHAGARHDAPEKAGLAHLLADLIVQDMKADALGVQVGSDGTLFSAELDKTELPLRLEAYLERITNPLLWSVDLANEQSLIAAKSASEEMDWISPLLDRALYGGVTDDDVSFLGTPASRLAITKEDLIETYKKAYQTSNITLILVGDLEPAAISDLVARAVRLPPDLPEERLTVERPVPKLPLALRAKAPDAITIFGHPLPNTTPSDCRALAGLLELRLLLRGTVHEAVASQINVRCRSVRGVDVILAYAISGAAQGYRLPELMREVFRGLANSPPTPAEIKATNRRLAHQLEALLADPARLADRVAEVAQGQRAAGAKTEIAGELKAAKLEWSRLAKLVKQSFSDRTEMFLHLAPTQG